jgi:uncharacterized membrane protein
LEFNQAESTEDDYYSVDVNSTKMEQTTDGKNPVEYLLTVKNNGNQIDTITIFTELLNVTGCTEPDISDWTFSLDTGVVTLGPSQSKSVVLTVTASCSCQVDCKAAIAVYATSSGDQTARDSIITYTIRGNPKQTTGLVVEIDFNQILYPLFIESTLTFDVNVYNFRNQKESIIVWASEAPIDWLVSLSPEEFTIQSRSIYTISLNFRIPKNIENGDYFITVNARFVDSPNIQGNDRIKVTVKPDIFINNISFSPGQLHAGEKIKLKIAVENIGLSTAINVSVLIYDEVNLIAPHRIYQHTIPTLEPNQMTNITFLWEPEMGIYNITVWLDDDNSIEELREDNNLRIESITISEGLEQEEQDNMFIAVSLLIIILLLIWLLIYYKVSNRPPKKDSPDTPRIESEYINIREKTKIDSGKRPKYDTDMSKKWKQR